VINNTVVLTFDNAVEGKSTAAISDELRLFNNERDLIHVHTIRK
jgi:hypothetical protein